MSSLPPNVEAGRKSDSYDTEDLSGSEPAFKRHRAEYNYDEEPVVPELESKVLPEQINYEFSEVVPSIMDYDSSDDDINSELLNESSDSSDGNTPENPKEEDDDVEDPMNDGRLHNEEEDAILIDDLDAYPSKESINDDNDKKIGEQEVGNDIATDKKDDDDADVQLLKNEASKLHVTNESDDDDSDYDYKEDSFKWELDIKNPEMEIPVLRKRPISLKIDESTGKCIFPLITKEKSLHCRSCLKYYDNETFLNAYIGNDQPPAGFYYLLRLLGFRMTNEKLLMKIMLSILNPENMGLPKKLTEIDELSLENMQELLYFDKSDCDHLLKDLTIALNNVLVGRIRLPNFNRLDQVIEKIKNANKILVLTGAGISTSLGIPDFRSKNGLYEKVSKLNLDDPQDVFTLDIFLENPSIFYSIAHEILPPDGIYSPLHAFIKLLQDKNKLLRNYTQNIDNIESFVGIDDDKIIQCHGSFATATCVTCNYCIKGTDIYSYIRSNTIPLCPYCLEEKELIYPTTPAGVGEHAIDKNTTEKGVFIGENVLSHDELNGDMSLNGLFDRENKIREIRNKHPSRKIKTHIEHTSKSFGVLKPDITFFGEGLPNQYNNNIDKDCKECDLLLCIGTSLKVQPVSNIVNLIDPKIPQILINRDDVRTNEFDVKLLGFCDDIAAYISKLLGWEIPHVRWEDEFKKAEFDVEELDNGLHFVKVKKE